MSKGESEPAVRYLVPPLPLLLAVLYIVLSAHTNRVGSTHRLGARAASYSCGPSCERRVPLDAPDGEAAPPVSQTRKRSTISYLPSTFLLRQPDSTLCVSTTVSAEDGALMGFIELALVFIYVCVLLIKTCYASPSVCAMYGFGQSASGEIPRTAASNFRP